MHGLPSPKTRLPSGALGHRRDIDGLRALAVLPVMAYHFGIPGFSGGFVGVDVFFVISGYLICGLIEADLAAGRFSLADFYLRRTLRILPALAVMFLAVSALAFVFLLPVEFKAYLQSLIAACLSGANLYFAKTADYFDATAGVKPLLHTWSLGVEEQFYIFVPLFLLLIHRLAPHRVRLLYVAVAVLSFLADLWLYNRNPTFAFYLMPTRAWELALGALLAVGVVKPPSDPRMRAGLGWLGLALVLGTVALGSAEQPLPLVTGLASLGAVLLIASSLGAPSPTGRLLSCRPLVFVGLISYSLYLWHWPLMVFQRTDLFVAAPLPEPVVQAGLVLASFLLAWFSWRYVEIPVRALRGQVPRAQVFAVAGAGMGLMCFVAALGLAANGLPWRFSPNIVRLGSYLAYDERAAFRTGSCFIDSNRQHFDAQTCLRMDPARRNILLLGDSHAAHLWLGLSHALPDANILQASASICRPVIMPARWNDTGFCPAMRHLVFDDFLTRNHVDRVLLSATWKAEDVPYLLHTLDVLKARGIPVTVLGPIVEYGQALPRLLADQARYGTPSLAAKLRDPLVPMLDRRMHALVDAKGAAYVSVYDAVCPAGQCTLMAGDVPLQFDTGHLTAAGSELIARRIAGRLH